MIFSFKGIEIHYEIIGEGKPIVMLHGCSPDHRLMVGCMEPIFESNKHYKRIYFDLPGMGLSTSSEWAASSDAILEIVLEFIDFIIPGESFLLAGESYGGYLARGVVHNMSNRVEGMLLICPSIVHYTKRTLPEKTVLVKNSDLLSTLSEEDRLQYESVAVVQDKATFEHFKRYVMPGLKLADSVFLEKLKSGGYVFSFDVDDANGIFEKPVLLIAGRQDTSVGYKDAWRIMDNYPRGSYVVLDRAGHALESEQKTVFKCLVKEWLMRCQEVSE